MAIANITNKRFLDSVGTGYLWEKIKNRYDSKLDEVTAADDSIVVANDNDIRVNISSEQGNLLELITTGSNKGLYVASSSTDRYEIVRDQTSNDYAAVYRLKKFTSMSDLVGVDVGVINIPKDMVVSSGSVVTYQISGDWGNPGTYIHLVLANATNDDLYIDVTNLLTQFTSGSQTGDMVMVDVDQINHEITATISDGTITMSKLSSTVQAAIANAGAIQTVIEGSTDGTIAVNGTDVAVHGLGTAAYTNSTAYDTAGAASAVLGTNLDTAATMTVYGVKQYASDVYDAIIAMSSQDIDLAIAAVDPSANGQSF